MAARLPAPEFGNGLISPQEAYLNFGPRWRVIRSRSIGAGEGLARLTLSSAFRGEPEQGWLLHPALMDLATGWAMGLIAGYQPDHLWVPVSYGMVRFLHPLPADIVSHVRSAASNHASDETARFDVTLATPEGKVCVEISGFTIRRLNGELSFTAPDARELTFDDGQGPSKPTSPAEERLLRAFSQGIRPEEGAQAFSRAILSGQSQIIVSSMDLPALIRQTAEVEQARVEGQSFARPDLDIEFVEPANDIERTLAQFWQELLGLGRVGTQDSFFDLGGHSLIAVRLFAMVKKAYRVEFPISILFEAPTIATCARLIADEIGVTEGDVTLAAPAKSKRRFTHLVPMHEGEGGPKAPFFLVAGMFGNVLNLRNLAQLLGTDRPFYGLQARGLLGTEPPHSSIPEAAADCIAELKQVQPQGPYLLGGFSGGGLTAWEMAHQLEAAGDRVSVLVLLDTPLPMRPTLTMRDKALIKIEEFRHRGPGYLLDWARARWEWELQKRNPKPADQGPAQFHNAGIEAAFRSAIAVYDLPKRSGAVALIRPPADRYWKVSKGNWVSAAKEYVFDDNDLTRFAPALQVIEVPGDHDSMVLEPNVRVMAGRLRALIGQAETQALVAGESAPPPRLAKAAE